MPELIGVAQFPFNVDLKRSLLLFDRIAIPAFRNCWQMTPYTDADWPGAGEWWSQVLADMDWLAAQGLLLDPCPTDELEAGRWLGRSMEGAERRIEEDGAEFFTFDAIARSLAVMLRQEGWNALPIVASDDFSLPADRVATRSDVVHVVLNGLHMPSDTHSLEDVVAFRDEAKSEGTISALRVWINEMASGKFTPLEIADRLEDMTIRYERALRVEKMRYETGWVESVVCTTAEIAESLCKFKWSKLARGLFQVKKQRIDLLRAEMELPGRELAYIVKARERFGK